MRNFEVWNATISAICQGERAGEPERWPRTAKVQVQPFTLLFENYGEIGRPPKVEFFGLGRGRQRRQERSDSKSQIGPPEFAT